jgi:hypothetical protein
MSTHILVQIASRFGASRTVATDRIRIRNDMSVDISEILERLRNRSPPRPHCTLPGAHP